MITLSHCAHKALKMRSLDSIYELDSLINHLSMIQYHSILYSTVTSGYKLATDSIIQFNLHVYCCLLDVVTLASKLCFATLIVCIFLVMTQFQRHLRDTFSCLVILCTSQRRYGLSTHYYIWKFQDIQGKMLL